MTLTPENSLATSPKVELWGVHTSRRVPKPGNFPEGRFSLGGLVVGARMPGIDPAARMAFTGRGSEDSSMTLSHSAAQTKVMSRLVGANAPPAREALGGAGLSHDLQTSSLVLLALVSIPSKFIAGDHFMGAKFLVKMSAACRSVGQYSNFGGCGELPIRLENVGHRAKIDLVCPGNVPKLSRKTTHHHTNRSLVILKDN